MSEELARIAEALVMIARTMKLIEKGMAVLVAKARLDVAHEHPNDVEELAE